MIDQPNLPIPLSPSEEENSKELLSRMGQIMTAWQGIEHAVFDIYRHFFEPDHFDVAAAVFFAVQAFETRMQMVDALMTQFANQHQSDKWKCLHNKIRKKSKTRNVAAHGVFAFFGTPPNREAVLCRSIYDITKFPDKPGLQDFTTAKELIDAAKTFSFVTKELYDFLEELKKEDAMLRSKLRARPQHVEENDRRYPATALLPRTP